MGDAEAAGGVIGLPEGQSFCTRETTFIADKSRDWKWVKTSSEPEMVEFVPGEPEDGVRSSDGDSDEVSVCLSQASRMQSQLTSQRGESTSSAGNLGARRH